MTITRLTPGDAETCRTLMLQGHALHPKAQSTRPQDTTKG